MTKHTTGAKIPIGIIFSTSGPYQAVGTEMLGGTLLAIEEINQSTDFDFTFAPVVCNPGGEVNLYAEQCRDLVKGGGISHVIGCYTSSSRKEIIPVIEKYDALLWYPSHYEGFESCNNVIYLGASPNQHIVPLAEYMLRNHGTRVYCCGSNYIWPWENNRVMRAIMTAAGGAILAERYLPIGSTDVSAIIEDIRHKQPDFIFNTLIGESSYAFFRAFHEAGQHDPRLNPISMPVTSCSLSEPELLQIGDPAACGHIASSVYFQSIGSRQNSTFVERYRCRFGANKVTSADAEASYNAALILAQAIKLAQSTDIDQVRKALPSCAVDAPQGAVRLDIEDNHCFLTPRIGRSTTGGRFDILYTAPAPVKPDPYLASLDLTSMGELSGEAHSARFQRLTLVRQ